MCADSMNNPNGFPWLNGGITRHTARPLKPFHIKSYMDNYLLYLRRDSKIELVDRNLRKREKMLKANQISSWKSKRKNEIVS